MYAVAVYIFIMFVHIHNTEIYQFHILLYSVSFLRQLHCETEPIGSMEKNKFQIKYNLIKV